MSLQLFAPPVLSSYCQKVLIALVGRRHAVRLSDARPGASGELRRAQAALAVRQVPAAGRRRRAGDRDDLHHRTSPGAPSRPQRWIPDGDLGRRVRFLDRFFDLYVMDNMQPAVNDALRPEGCARPLWRRAGRASNLHIAYDWLEANLRRRAVGGGRRSSRWPTAPPRRRFSTPTGSRRSATEPSASSQAYRARLLAHPSSPARSTRRRPYRPYFPLGAPDRD